MKFAPVAAAAIVALSLAACTQKQEADPPAVAPPTEVTVNPAPVEITPPPAEPSTTTTESTTTTAPDPMTGDPGSTTSTTTTTEKR